MSSDNIFKELAKMKAHKPVVKSTGCNICTSGLVNVRHSETKAAYVFKCTCPLGRGRTEAFPEWNNSIEYEPLYIEE